MGAGRTRGSAQLKPEATILLADDHPLLCSGLKAMLEPPYTVVAMVHHGDDVVAMVERCRPDVVIMDLSLPGQHGISLTQQLKATAHPPRVLVVTMHADPVYVEEALRAGADGYLLKTTRAAEIRKGVAEVLAGRPYVALELRPSHPAGPAVGAAAEPPQGGAALDGVQYLTGRQLEVLHLVGKGLTSIDIGARLGISIKAIEYHRSSIRAALGLTSQAAFYRYAALYAERLARSDGAPQSPVEEHTP